MFLILNIFFFHSAGGVEAYTSDGKIKIINTLEARLSMLFSQVNNIKYQISLP